MNMKEYYISLIIKILSVLILISFTSCRQKPTGVVTVHTTELEEEEFDPYVIGNKRILALEKEEIELVIKRHKWNMNTTGSGLCYEILTPGQGDCYMEGDSVIMNYTIALLSGKIIYDSENDGMKTFRVEKSEEIPALHEMAKLVSPGAKVRMLVPSHLAYGVGGDGNKINGREALLMNVEFLNH